MNILVIGNGFDLAHGLPTKYGDFLEFVRVIEKLYDELKDMWSETYIVAVLNGCNLDSKIKNNISVVLKSRKSNEVLSQNLDNLYKLVEYNFWIEYFSHGGRSGNRNWIDFESEIRDVIKSIDGDMQGQNFNEQIQQLSNNYLRDVFLFRHRGLGNQKERRHITYEELRNTLIQDLQDLIWAFDIYLYDFIENMQCEKISLDMKDKCFDNVLSFNYTDTYKRIYDVNGLAQYNYIHGKTSLDHVSNNNNMVLGIDEYLSDKRKNRDIQFIAFKKFYQRIYKGTGCDYKDWIYTIKESGKAIESRLKIEYPVQIPFFKFTNDTRHNLCIFGHSLDASDKDILRDLILNDNVYTTIFYFNKDDLGSKIANLVKVIGQDELIRRTGGSTKTIEFKLQQDMVEVLKFESKERKNE